MVAESNVSLTPALATVRVRLGAGFSLTCLILGSITARSLAVLTHPTIGYLPDEYTYGAISRSLAAHGRPLVRGSSAHFPALLEPLLAAPLWMVGATDTGYRLVQIENAVFMSLAAVPVYLLARRLELGTIYSIACAAFALAIPDLGYSAFVLSDPIAYLLAVSAVYAGVVALQTTGRRWQLAFVALAGLATLARMQLVVLVPAFVVASVILDRRSFIRAQRLPLALFGLAAGVFVALGPGRLLGDYAAVGKFKLHRAFAYWAALDPWLLALAGGVVLVPGAIAGLLTARDRASRAFAALVATFAVLVMFETAAVTANDTGHFIERYLFVLLPFVPLAFGIFANSRPRYRLLVTTLAAGVALAVALLPLSGFAAAYGATHSPLLWAYLGLEGRIGTGNASLVFALAATAAAALAAATAWTRLRLVPIIVAIALMVALSVGATVYDRSYSHAVRAQLVAPNPSWVDAAQLGHVSAVETDLAPREQLLEQMFWNTSIDRELLLGSESVPSDTFATRRLTVSRDGALMVGVAAVRSPILFQGFAVTAVLRNAVRVSRYSSFSLWRPAGTPRLSVLEGGRYWDGWLSPGGKLEVWPADAAGGTVSFTLSLPRDHHGRVRIRFGTHLISLAPGKTATETFRIHGPGPWSIPFRVDSGVSALDDKRFVSVRSTTPVFTPAPKPGQVPQSG